MKSSDNSGKKRSNSSSRAHSETDPADINIYQHLSNPSGRWVIQQRLTTTQSVYENNMAPVNEVEQENETSIDQNNMQYQNYDNGM